MESETGTSSLDSLKKLYREDDDAKTAASFEAIKEQLADKARKLKDLQEQLAEVDRYQKTLSKEHSDLLEEVRIAWLPFIHGSSSAILKFDNGVSVTSEETLSITCEDSEVTNKWFLENGYEGVMKYQIHNQTLKKIARELYEKGQEIPAVKYSKFRYVKVK